MATSLKPLGDRVVVKPKPKEELTKSGVVLPDTASEKPHQGTVLSAGLMPRRDRGPGEQLTRHASLPVIASFWPVTGT